VTFVCDNANPLVSIEQQQQQHIFHLNDNAFRFWL
jgi:hypothetical protein